MIVKPSALAGSIRVPGDKSITHRAVMFASIAEGRSEIVFPGTGEDNLDTLRAMQALGVEASHDDAEHFTVVGRGFGGLQSPAEPIYCGNSGTTVRLLVGLLAGAGIQASLTGDPSLSRRPMRRVAEPLLDLGYDVSTGEGGLLPLTINPDVRPQEPDAGTRAFLKIASAQVKSCILLAGLSRERPTAVVEPAVSRDHTERLLRAMGARVVSTAHYLDPERYQDSAEAPEVRLYPGRPLRGRTLEVPGDPSSAAFLLSAAALGGDGVQIRSVGTNPTRIRFLDVLERMGALVTRESRRVLSTGEPAADVRVRPAALKATTIGGWEVPLLIDEIPVLCVVGAASTGRFVVRDAAELKVKESDRIERTVALLAAMGVEAQATEDGLWFEGRGSANWEAFEFDCGDDHRIAMAAVVAALMASGPCELQGTDCIAVSYPEFVETLGVLGAEIQP